MSEKYSSLDRPIFPVAISVPPHLWHVVMARYRLTHRVNDPAPMDSRLQQVRHRGFVAV
jgi:hypothetical protein